MHEQFVLEAIPNGVQYFLFLVGISLLSYVYKTEIIT